MTGNTLLLRIEAVLAELRPYFHADGGDVHLVDVDVASGVVHVHLVGACAGCPSATATLQQGVLLRLQEAVPEITDVVPVARRKQA